MRPTLRAWFVAAAACIAARQGTAAPAKRPVGDAIRVEAGRTCLDERRLEAHVRTWLGTDHVEEDVHVIVRGSPARADAAEFRLVRAKKTAVRRFESIPAGCEEAHAAVGLAVALAIDADVLRRVAALAPPEPPFRRFTVQGGAGYDVLPSLSFGARVGVEHELLDWLSGVVEIGAQHSPDNEIRGAAGAFSASLISGHVRVCAGQPLTDALEITLCGGFAAGAIHARGSGYATTRSPTGAWVGAQSGIRIDFRAGLRWIVDVELVAPLHSPPFRVERAGAEDAVRNPQPTGMAVHFGPSFAF